MNLKTKERLLFFLGVAICVAVAAFSVLLEELIPGALMPVAKKLVLSAYQNTSMFGEFL